MKTLIILLLLLAPLMLRAQILNGGFEGWTNGNPNEWALYLGGGANDSIAVEGKYSLFIKQDLDRYSYRSPVPILSNTIPQHPSGSAVPLLANSVSFWAICWNQDFEVHLRI